MLVLCCALLPLHAITAAILDVNDAHRSHGPLRGNEFIRPIENLENAGSEHHADFEGVGDAESQTDGDDDGYLRTKANKGSSGYKHFDSFHKKNGDKWEKEKHSGNGGNKDGGDHGNYYTSNSYSYDSRQPDANGKKSAIIVHDESDDAADHGDFSFDGDEDHDRYDEDSEGDHHAYHQEDDDLESHYEEEADERPMPSIGSNLGSSAFRAGDRAHHYHGGGGGSGGGGGGATSYYIRHY